MELVTIAEKVGNVRSSVGPQTVADYDFTTPALDLILSGRIGTIPSWKTRP